MDDKYFERYINMFATDGWKQFIEEMTDIFNTYDYDLVHNYEDFLKIKSARDQLSRVINFEAGIRLSLENFEEDENLYEED